MSIHHKLDISGDSAFGTISFGDLVRTIFGNYISRTSKNLAIEISQRYQVSKEKAHELLTVLESKGYIKKILSDGESNTHFERCYKA